MPNRINVSDFDLASTLECGQAFRWKREADGWFVGVVGREVWRLRQHGRELEWETDPKPTPNPSREGNSGLPSSGGAGGGSSQIRMTKYLSIDQSLRDITSTFPADDESLHAAVRRHWGLRILRQEPWECLASFIASSSKQIVQIRQIVDLLARRFGEPIGDGFHAFPTVGVIARASHQELWDCKLGFRAKYLLATARLIQDGKVDLAGLRSMEYDRAVEELQTLAGVGEKIANCVLLFSCGFNRAFPIDVWIERALQRIYFPENRRSDCRSWPDRKKSRVGARRLREFAGAHFGPYAGWAQQYLFFNERTTVRGKQALHDE